MLLEELTDVIARPFFSQRLSSIRKTVRQVLADYIEIVELVEPLEIPRIVRDPDDDHVLACALVANVMSRTLTSLQRKRLSSSEIGALPHL